MFEIKLITFEIHVYSGKIEKIDDGKPIRDFYAQSEYMKYNPNTFPSPQT